MKRDGKHFMKGEKKGETCSMTTMNVALPSTQTQNARNQPLTFLVPRVCVFILSGSGLSRFLV